MEIIPYREDILKYVEKLKEKLGAKLIILYGSIAKGNFGVGSDIDILIVSDALPENFLERLKVLFLLNESFAPIEAIGYKSDEFRKMVVNAHPIALDALYEGIILHKDEKYEKEIRKIFREVMKRVRKEDFGWIKL
ncbi:MAG: nucleotidyltransferase domain-containing protein [Thermoplasmatales archaeon]|nr:nucleotidyltransferase domain-containing protein [Thermoplasmatales archaeon]